MTNDAPPAAVPAPPAEAQWRSLRTLIHCLAIAVLILTGTVFVFLYRQVVITRKNTAEMVRYLMQYEESDTEEMIDRVRQRLDAYRQQNPEFSPIYVKYFGSNEPAGGSKVAPMKVAPAPTNSPGSVTP